MNTANTINIYVTPIVFEHETLSVCLASGIYEGGWVGAGAGWQHLGKGIKIVTCHLSYPVTCHLSQEH